MEFRISGTTLVLLVAPLLFVGCQSALDRPNFDPQKSATLALEQCDQNGDGQISQAEASAAPGLVSSFTTWDANNDKQISKEEIAERVASYRTSTGSVSSAAFIVTYKTKPLEGAQVTLDPEPFMGDGFAPATATTDHTGYVRVNRPDMGERGYPGVYLGVYRVRISKQENGQEMLPAKYNTESQLGFDSGEHSRSSRVSPRFDLE